MLHNASIVGLRQFVNVAMICLTLALSLAGQSTTMAETPDDEINVKGFEEHVKDQPLALPVAIETKCVRCHNPSTRKGELDLSSREGLAIGGESGEPLLHAEKAESRLWQVIEHDEMPPDGESDLSEAEIQQIEAWIDSENQLAMKSPAASESFSFHDVLPIFLLRCASCHGGQRQDGGFDVRTYRTILEGGQSGQALLAGKPDASLIVQRIVNEQCPPSDLLLKFFVKRPSDSEIERIQKWITAGAPEGSIVADIATDSADPLVSDEDREHWAFSPPQRPNHGKCIDDFIEQRLNQNELKLAPVADRDTLIRRAFIDLTGLPPSLTQWQQWRDQSDPNWFSLMINELLDSPHYGERWGRYWLDLAGYADSEGGISADPIRPVAWKYRDYVIRSFNQDKPYDKFLIEQLAGDELTDHANIDSLNDAQVDELIATGFLRMGIDETGSRTMNFVPERLKVIDDAITIVSSGLMGITMECARCHSHKYDPIPQRDYYRLKAVFQGALDEHHWKSFKQRTLNLGTATQREAITQRNPPLEKEQRSLQNDLRQLNHKLALEILRAKYPDQPEADRDATLAALKIADNQRTLPQRRLVEKLQVAQNSHDALKHPVVQEIQYSIDEVQNRIESIEQAMAPPLTIRALWDEGNPSPTYILRRGEHTQFGRLVGPGVPSVLTDGKTAFLCQPPFPQGSHKTGRRLAFAQWLTSDKHPTTARVMVNRVWHHHFGKGLVATLENFGVMGARPTHPELLDWLAIEFMSHGWSVKELHRQIMNSRTYRQSSVVDERSKQLDPDNQLYSRMPLRRMDAETLRDSLLLVSGRLDRRRGGIPDPVQVDREGEVRIKPTPDQQFRRSVYAQYRRTEIPTLLDTFDYPKMGPNCFERSVSTVSPQALLLLNNRRIHELAKSFSARLHRIREDARASNEGADIDQVIRKQPDGNLLKEKATSSQASTSNTASATTDRQNVASVKEAATHQHLITLAYQLAMSRSPNPEELRLGLESIEALTKQWNGDETKALQSYCHALLNSASFLYID